MNDRLISLSAAIDTLTENKEMINAAIDSLTLDYNMRRNLEQRRGQIDEDIEAIMALPPAEPDPKWIPCSEKLPDKEGVYLVTDKNAFWEKISMRYWNIHEKDAFWSGYESDVVLAWQPLPTPWEGYEN